MDTDTLVAQLQKANWAYHNTSMQLMTDDAYDAGLEELRRRSPAHPFLRVIGAAPNAKGVLLPYTMASLDKVRFGEEGLTRWLRRWTPQESVVITEKLDGLSALYCCDAQGTQRMYLRGDGVKGVDVSTACKSISIPKVTCVVRGEILLSNAATPEGSIGRSLVNGWLHRLASGPVEELAKCHFVAYQVIEPARLTRSQQMTWLESRGFRIPTHTMQHVKTLDNSSAKEVLVQWKAKSVYPLDGIVIGIDRIPLASSGGEASNPDDAVAFKAALDEQKAETTILTIQWNLSRQNIYIPRIQIQPVSIGGARIEWLSGHNAAFVEENGLGPGAEIVIRRSGDVIPTLDAVITKVTPSLPDGTWDDTHTHIKQTTETQEGKVVMQEKAMLHALQTLGVDGVGPGLVKKLVESGLTSMKKVYEADASVLWAAIGGGRGASLKQNLVEALEKATQLQLLLASNLLPRGTGEKKLRGLYDNYPDAKSWTSENLSGAPGWSADSLESLLLSLPKALLWIEHSFGSYGSVVKVQAEAKVEAKGETHYVCFTRCRVKEMPAGWEEIDTISKRCELLVVADDAKESAKTKKAKEMGIPIETLSVFQQRLNPK